MSANLNLPNTVLPGFTRYKNPNRITTVERVVQNRGVVPVLQQNIGAGWLLWRASLYYQVVSARNAISQNPATLPPYSWYGYIIPTLNNEPLKPLRLDFRSGIALDIQNDLACIANWMFTLTTLLEGSLPPGACPEFYSQEVPGLNFDQLIFSSPYPDTIYLKLTLEWLAVRQEGGIICLGQPTQTASPTRPQGSLPTNGSAPLLPYQQAVSPPYDALDNVTPGVTGVARCYKTSGEGLSLEGNSYPTFTDYVVSQSGLPPVLTPSATNPYTGDEPWDRVFVDGSPATNTTGNPAIGYRPGTGSVMPVGNGACGI